MAVSRWEGELDLARARAVLAGADPVDAAGPTPAPLLEDVPLTAAEG